ncbi:alpha/beta fold hydrolase [Vibrio fluvialis]|uniref:alpha/beta fold hydrolase n=1 Tax=Vibrio fluvialis TaxID=676 RepID=UPI0028F6C340|nr:alpha/beta hydrolase [Vibrio fluvialis]
MTNIEGTFNAEGAQLHYQIHRQPQRHTVLVMHGGLGSSHDLLTLYAAIPEDYQIVSVDFRGHGRSTLGHGSLSYARYQADIEALLDHLGIDEFSILGFSDGGIVGYRLAAAHPDRVKRLITLGSQWRLEAGDPSIEVLKGLTPEFWIARFQDDVARYEASNPQPDFAHLVEKVKTLWLDTTESGYPNRQVVEILCPTLVIRGDNDFLFSLPEAVALVETLKDGHFMNVPFVAHGVHLESPHMVAMAVSHFLTCTLANAE